MRVSCFCQTSEVVLQDRMGRGLLVSMLTSVDNSLTQDIDTKTSKVLSSHSGDDFRYFCKVFFLFFFFTYCSFNPDSIDT